MFSKNTKLLVTGFFARKIVKMIQSKESNLVTLKEIETHINSILRGKSASSNYSTSYSDIVEDLHNYGECLRIIEKIIPDIKNMEQLTDYILTMLSEVHGAMQTQNVSKENLEKTYKYYHELRTYCVNNFDSHNMCM